MRQGMRVFALAAVLSLMIDSQVSAPLAEGNDDKDGMASSEFLQPGRAVALVNGGDEGSGVRSRSSLGIRFPDASRREPPPKACTVRPEKFLGADGNWRRAFNKALRWLDRKCGGGTLQLASRTYRIPIKSNYPDMFPTEPRYENSIIPVSNVVIQGTYAPGSAIEGTKLEFEATIEPGQCCREFGFYLTDQRNVVFRNLLLDGLSDSTDPTPNGTYNLIFFRPVYEGAVSDVTIEECEFRNTWNAAVNSYGRDDPMYSPPPQYHSSHIIVQDSLFEDIGDHGVAMNEWDDSVVRGSTFRRMGGNGYSGLGIDVSAGCHRVRVEDNVVDSALGGVKCESILCDPARYGKKFCKDNPDYDLTDDVVFARNNVRNISLHYALRGNCTNLTVEDNSLETSVQGINIAHLASHVRIERNTLLHTGGGSDPWVGIRLNGARDAFVANNVVSGMVRGITVELMDDVRIADNEIHGNRWEGVRVLAGSRVDVMGNRIWDNGVIGVYVAKILDYTINDLTIGDNVIWDTSAPELQNYGIYIELNDTHDVVVRDNRLCGHPIAPIQLAGVGEPPLLLNNCIGPPCCPIP